MFIKNNIVIIMSLLKIIFLIIIKFPKDTNKKNKWLEALGMKNYNPPSTTTVCSKHFKKEDFKSDSAKRRLKANAIPYVCIKIIYI